MHLTPREKEIVKRLLKAEKREAMACDLGIVPRTVHFHLSNVRRKLGVQTSLEVAIFFAANPSQLDSLQLSLF